MIVRVPGVSVMDDETVMLHLEKRHEDELKMNFLPEPDRSERRLRAPEEWRTYHDAMHRLCPSQYDHRHNDVNRG
jgi:hypothetical protein